MEEKSDATHFIYTIKDERIGYNSHRNYPTHSSHKTNFEGPHVRQLV